MRNFRMKRRIDDAKLNMVKCCEIDFDFAVDVFKEEYMRDDWSQRTLSFHLENMSVFKKYLEAQVGNLNLVTGELLDDYVKNMRSAGKKKNTINGRVKTLRVFFRVLLCSARTATL